MTPTGKRKVRVVVGYTIEVEIERNTDPKKESDYLKMAADLALAQFEPVKGCKPSVYEIITR
jgi:hypothetical protein